MRYRIVRDTDTSLFIIEKNGGFFGWRYVKCTVSEEEAVDWIEKKKLYEKQAKEYGAKYF